MNLNEYMKTSEQTDLKANIIPKEETKEKETFDDTKKRVERLQKALSNEKDISKMTKKELDKFEKELGKDFAEKKLAGSNAIADAVKILAFTIDKASPGFEQYGIETKGFFDDFKENEKEFNAIMRELVEKHPNLAIDMSPEAKLGMFMFRLGYGRVVENKLKSTFSHTDIKKERTKDSDDVIHV